MLVCNVSLVAPRAAISVSVTEAAVALDSPGTGNVVFAALIDDPASVRDRVDAWLGEIMVEAASAAASVNAGLTYAAAVVEAAVAVDLLVGAVPTAISAAVVEAASAIDAPVALLAAPPFQGALALDGPIMPSNPQPTVILIEG